MTDPRLIAEIVNDPSILSEEDFDNYCVVIQSSFEVHLDREKIRRGLWKDYSARDQLIQVKLKAERAIRVLESLAPLTKAEVNNVREECFDIINYANFAARQVNR